MVAEHLLQPASRHWSLQRMTSMLDSHQQIKVQSDSDSAEHTSAEFFELGIQTLRRNCVCSLYTPEVVSYFKVRQRCGWHMKSVNWEVTPTLWLRCEGCQYLLKIWLSNPLMSVSLSLASHSRLMAWELLTLVTSAVQLFGGNNGWTAWYRFSSSCISFHYLTLFLSQPNPWNISALSPIQTQIND